MSSAKGIRLHFRKKARKADGRARRKAQWFIYDGNQGHPTGFGKGDIALAQIALREYLAKTYPPERRKHSDPDEVLVADAVKQYAIDKIAKLKNGAKRKDAVARHLKILDFFGDKMIGDITGFVVTDFINQSNTLPAARRQLEDLRAALNHYRDEGYIRYAPAIKLPKKAEPKVRWLSRDEAARLIRAAMHMKQSWKGQTSERYTGRHLARFILIGIYTGTRSAAIFNAAIRPTTGRGYVDLNRGVFYRKAHDAVDTRKRQTPVRIADRLLVHMRRWATTEFTLGQHTVRRGKSKNIGRMISQDYIVEWEGKPVQSIKNAFRKACKIAGLGWHVWDEKKGRNVFKTDVTPHILRHTAATWLMQNGASPSDAADYLGMTEPVLRKHYYHQHPDFQAGVAERTTAKPQALTVKSRIVRRRYDGQGPPDGEAAWWTSRDR